MKIIQNWFLDDYGFSGRGFVTFIVAGLAALILGLNALVERSCNIYQTATGKETRYFFLDSCYIKTASGWQRWDEYRARAVASEGLSK